MSSAKPRLLFAVEEEEEEEEPDGVWSFFSLPQLQNPYEESSSSTLVVAAELHVKFRPGDLRIHPCLHLDYFQCAYASGLIYFNASYSGPLVCNPNTGQYAILPSRDEPFSIKFSFFGFDPIDKQYKVFFMNDPKPGNQRILTLGIDKRWRQRNCSLPHSIKSKGVCINGVLYYLGYVNDAHDVTSRYVIVCFELRSEKFTFIDVERFCRLLNYKEKLAVIFWEDDFDFYNEYYYFEDDVDADTLHVWVQEDVEKQEWSKYAYTLSDDKFFCHCELSAEGVTASGEIVFVMEEYIPKRPFYVFYFNPEKNTLRRVEIQGFGEMFRNNRAVRTSLNHIEDLNAHNVKLLNSVHAAFLESQEDSECDWSD